MFLLGRLLRRKAGPTPSSVVDLRGHQEVEVHILARALLSLQGQVETLTQQHREIVGRLDEVEGKPNSTMGDSAARREVLAGR